MPYRYTKCEYIWSSRHESLSSSENAETDFLCSIICQNMSWCRDFDIFIVLYWNRLDFYSEITVDGLLFFSPINLQEILLIHLTLSPRFCCWEMKSFVNTYRNTLKLEFVWQQNKVKGVFYIINYVMCKFIWIKTNRWTDRIYQG